MREKLLFDFGWLFHKGDIEQNVPPSKGPVYMSAKTERKKWGPASIYYNDATDDYRQNTEFCPDKWVNVDLPHDYVISGEPKESNNPALGFFDYENAWYRKHFSLSKQDADKRITLYFEGVATRCTVYLNGCELYSNFCGYTSFEIDISDYVKFEEENILAVYTKFDAPEGWWYQGGGIYRHVWLCKTDLCAVDLYGVYAAPQLVAENNWKINLETTVLNEYYEDKTVTVLSKIFDESGKLVASASADTSIPKKSKTTASYFVMLNNPMLWDTDNPYQYSVETDIIIDAKTVDTYKTKFGCRYFKFDADKGFFLNGRRVFIKGVCGHGDFGLTGKAMSDNMARYRVKLMKEMGANGYRTSHYPQCEAIMDALDEAGFIVMDETRWFDSTPEGKHALEMLMKRDRNRPSVFMWSLGNEEPLHITDEGRRINKTLYAFAEKLDKYRPITAAVSNSPDNATVYDDLDLLGVNYNHWLYDSLRKKYPKTPIFSSECCATGTTRGWYLENCDEKAYINAYDKDTNEWFTGREFMWNFLSEREYVFGCYQWIAFEHRGEALWPRICSQAGAIDLFMQKKDAFYQNQSFWADYPVIHLLPHWNWEFRAGEKIPVFAYTNCEQSELFLNGKSLGKQQTSSRKHGEWQVEYQAGVLEVVGYNDGKEAARDKVETTGKAVKLMLSLDYDEVKANGSDIAMITCYCVDEQGRTVPDAEPKVSFFCNELGTIVGTGSDISDHTPIGCTGRQMRAGAIGVAVKTGTTPGALKLYASSEGLKPAALCIDIK